MRNIDDNRGAYIHKFIQLTFIIQVLCGVCFAQAKLSEAITLTNAGDYAKALTVIDDYLRKNGSDQRAIFTKAVILTGQKDYSRALGFVEKAISIETDNAEYYRLAAQLYEELDKIKLAVPAWYKCQKLAKDTRLFVEAKNHVEYLSRK